jgi:hypothetical protein
MIPTETRERFILGLVDQLGTAEIFEGHFFSPRRVSGVERGVAVIAARQTEPPPAEPGDAAATAIGIEALGELAVEATGGDGAPEAPGEAPAELEAVTLESLNDSPYAPEAPDQAAGPDRYTVFTATYRHTLKGPDRGKWEVSVKAEADAPLVTVDQVVRGVQRRAEDTDDVERLTGEEIRALVEAHQPAAG